jgi:hypothetical protein
MQFDQRTVEPDHLHGIHPEGDQIGINQPAPPDAGFFLSTSDEERAAGHRHAAK